MKETITETYTYDETGKVIKKVTVVETEEIPTQPETNPENQVQ